MSQDKSSADLLIEFLKMGGKSAVENLEQLKVQLKAIEDANKEAKMIDDSISMHLSQNRQLEVENKKALEEILYHKAELIKMQDSFAAEKLEAKKNKEYADKMMSEVQNKIGEAEAKIKRLSLQEENLKGAELQNLVLKQKLDATVKQINKLMNELQ
jgi:hypothetical protein